ncbi:acyloxyacyl hydrolase [Gaoshiqia sp. Z1-71]|uniref:acyloxyacyl hydrolase n=1 Tax=Gaoshiqia hydrogeniformans TaxID=3290090 RepID=UPI003BF79702
MQVNKIIRIFFIVFISGLAGKKLEGKDTNPYRQFRFIEIKGHSGSHYYSGESLSDALKNGYRAVEVRYGWQSNNPDGWQSKYRYPGYGVGWYSGFIGDPNVLGMPGALYGFISFPLFQFRRHEIGLEPAFGISYDLNPYDEENNSDNDAIGSRFNVYFNLNLGGRYRITREIDLLYGLDITHLSNGRTYLPNSGLNMFGPNLGIRYNFNARQNKIDNSPNPTKILDVRPVLDTYRKAMPVSEYSLLFYMATGLVQDREHKGSNKQYSTFSSILEGQYKFTEKSAISLGFDAFYDSSLKISFPDHSVDFYGAHLGYDFMFWKMAIRMQGGTYLHQKARNFKGSYFLRPALKFDLSRVVYFQLGLKTQNGFIADWVEYGLGIRLF